MKFSQVFCPDGLSQPAAVFIALATLVMAGWLDYFTGMEVIVLPLYFLPLQVASWYLGRVGAVVTATLTTFVWLAAMYHDGIRFQHWSIWVINGIMDGMCFIYIALVLNSLRNALRREGLLSRTDALTGLANRRAFSEIIALGLEVSRRQLHPVSLAVIDLDGFKRVNDTFGHAKGDEVLCRCAEILTHHARSSDSVARLGGDEFSVFLPGASLENATHMCERIRLALSEDELLDSVGVTASIGVVCESNGDGTLDVLLHSADSMMYEAKRNGKNSVRGQIAKNP